MQSLPAGMTCNCGPAGESREVTNIRHRVRAKEAASLLQQCGNHSGIQEFSTMAELSDPDLVEFWSKDLGGRSQDREQLASGKPRPDPPEPREQRASGTAGGNTSTAQLERVDLVPEGVSDRQKCNRNVRQPSRMQRLGIEPTITTSEIARTTDPNCDRPRPTTTTALEDVPRRKEAFKQLVNSISGRGTTAGYRGDPRGRQLCTKSKVRRDDEQMQQPPKRNKSTNASSCDDRLVPTGLQSNHVGLPARWPRKVRLPDMTTSTTTNATG